jgi:hypothetical protein
MREITEFRVVWSDSKCFFLDKFLRKGFGHVQICFKVGGIDTIDEWIAIHTSGRQLKIVQISNTELESKTAGLSAMTVSIDEFQEFKFFWGLTIPTCVTLIKRILNIRAWWIITPWQLYNYMQENYIQGR